jgi:hypothetical protein
MSGPQFSDLKPQSVRGVYAPEILQAVSPGGLNNGKIWPVLAASPNPPDYSPFREGETLLIYIECGFPAYQDGETYVSGLRIKPWWLRSNVEFRTPGDPVQSGNPPTVMGGVPSAGASPYPSQIDTQVFGGWYTVSQPFDPSAGQFDPVNLNTLGNRNVWYPSPKRLDTVPSAWGSSPLNIALTNTSDSVLFDDVWYIPLPNPTSAPWNAAPWSGGSPVLLGCPPNYRQNKVFSYPAFGRCLGVSFEVTLALVADDSPVVVPPGEVPVPPNNVYPFVRIGYRSGVTHAVIQERLG